MKQIPVDVSELRFLVASDPEQVVDFETGQPKTNREGQSLFSVDLLISGVGRKGELITVKVAGSKPTVTQGITAKASKLVASHWQQGNRAGISFSAEKVEALTGKAA